MFHVEEKIKGYVTVILFVVCMGFGVLGLYTMAFAQDKTPKAEPAAVFPLSKVGRMALSDIQARSMKLQEDFAELQRSEAALHGVDPTAYVIDVNNGVLKRLAAPPPATPAPAPKPTDKK